MTASEVSPGRLTSPSAPSRRATTLVCSVLVALVVGLAGVAGGATGATERVAFAAMLCATAVIVAVLEGSLAPIARPTPAELMVALLAVFAATQALLWPDALARSLAPYAYASRSAALGTQGGVAASLDRGASARAALVVAGLAFLAASARVIVARGGLHALLRTLALVVLAHAAAGIVRGRYGEDEPLLLGFVADNPINAFGTFPNRTQYAAFLLALLVAPVGLLFRPRAPLDRPLGAVAAIAIGVGVVLSGSRAGVIGLALAAGVAALGAARGRRAWASAGLVLLGGGAVVARAAGLPVLVRLLPLRGDEGDRLEIWRGALELAGEQPVVGIGLDAFRYAYPAQTRGPLASWAGIAENDVLQFVAEMGAVGVLLALCAAFFAVRSLRRDRRLAGSGAVTTPVALVGLAGLLPLTMTSSPLHQPAVAAAAVLSWACARSLVRGDGGPPREDDALAVRE